MGEFEAIETHPDKSDTLVITFKDRQTAEGFIHGTKDIPNVGKLQYSWYNAPSTATASSPNPVTKVGGVSGNDSNDVTIGDDSAITNGDERGATGEVDYDVAEEDDRWN